MDTQTLLQQIGLGNLMAVGARRLVKGEASVSFRCGPERRHRMLVITLTPADTYNVRFVELPKHGAAIVEDVEDVYCDNIGEVVRRLGDRP